MDWTSFWIGAVAAWTVLSVIYFALGLIWGRRILRDYEAMKAEVERLLKELHPVYLVEDIGVRRA